MKKERTVLIATGLYPPEIGGPATYSKLLYDFLPEHGVRVKLACFRTVRWLPKGIRHVLFFLIVFVKAFGVDVVYALDPVSVGFPASWAARLLKKTFVLKVVGDYAWEQYQNGEGVSFITPEAFQTKVFDSATERRRRIEHSVAHRAKRIIVPSEYLKKIVQAWGVNEEKIEIIHNAFTPVGDVGRKEVLRQFLNFKGTLIMSVGRLEPWKGFDTLVECIPSILKTNPNTRLFIVGDGPQEVLLKRKIKDLGLENNVVLTGRLDRPTLMNYLAASDLFVLNTGYEGLSHQLLEVMALGIPIVTTNVGGNPELIENKKTGILVQYGDNKSLCEAIVKMLSDEKGRSAMVQNAKEKVKGFNPENMISKTVSLLESP